MLFLSCPTITSPVSMYYEALPFVFPPLCFHNRDIPFLTIYTKLFLIFPYFSKTLLCLKREFKTLYKNDILTFNLFRYNDFF